jgi:hypothetical protein
MRLSRILAPLAGALLLLLALTLTAAGRADEGWGTIKGRVEIEGPVPARKPINVDKDKEHCLTKGPLFSEDYVVNTKNKGVKNVMVWLIDPKNPRAKLPVHPSLQNVKLPAVEIDQPCCQFVPHIVAMREGQDLVVKNSAPIAHNVHVIGGVKGPDFNVILPPGGEKKVAADEIPARPTPITVKCDIHPWMGGYIRVFSHPYFAITDEDGNFTIKDAPAGDWRIVIWQESKGWVRGDKNGTPITVKAGAVTDLGTVGLTPSAD